MERLHHIVDWVVFRYVEFAVDEGRTVQRVRVSNQVRYFRVQHAEHFFPMRVVFAELSLFPLITRQVRLTHGRLILSQLVHMLE